MGWGLSGFCPGGAIPAIGLIRPEPVLFTATMAAGIAMVKIGQGLRRRCI
ncbi:DUF6691 family protein [Paracoccus versutus]